LHSKNEISDLDHSLQHYLDDLYPLDQISMENSLKQSCQLHTLFQEVYTQIEVCQEAEEVKIMEYQETHHLEVSHHLHVRGLNSHEKMDLTYHLTL
jgi:hypothetical protein